MEWCVKHMFLPAEFSKFLTLQVLIVQMLLGPAAFVLESKMWRRHARAVVVFLQEKPCCCNSSGAEGEGQGPDIEKRNVFTAGSATSRE